MSMGTETDEVLEDIRADRPGKFSRLRATVIRPPEMEPSILIRVSICETRTSGYRSADITLSLSCWEAREALDSLRVALAEANKGKGCEAPSS